MNLLTVCIPTYKRAESLIYCIDSVINQINEYHLHEYVNIYIANDASPDETIENLSNYNDIGDITIINRETNLGMNQNIKKMLMEAASWSEYQLILTDDDYLEDNILIDIVDFLNNYKLNVDSAPAIWTPRYSYTEDGNFYSVVCKPFNKDKYLSPSVINAAKYMNNGFVLSGLILESKKIDFQFWNQYSKNAYFPAIILGDLIISDGAYYWNKNIVHHTVLNECHWERWGDSDIKINLRLCSDYYNIYKILSKRILSKHKQALFYLYAFSNIFESIKNRVNILNPYTNIKISITKNIIKELKETNIANFDFATKILVMLSLSINYIFIPMKHIFKGLLNTAKSNITTSTLSLFNKLKNTYVLSLLFI